MTSSVKV